MLIEARGAGSAVAAQMPGRERLLHPASVGAFVALVAICLVLLFPREPLHGRLLGDDLPVDGVARAYLHAAARVSPGNVDLMAVLAEQYAREGRLQEAETLLAQIGPMAGAAARRSALPMLRARLDIVRQRMHAARPDTAEREQLLDQARLLLEQALRLPAKPSDLVAFAVQSREIGADDLEMSFYRTLAGVDHPRKPVLAASSASSASSESPASVAAPRPMHAVSDRHGELSGQPRFERQGWVRPGQPVATRG